MDRGVKIADMALAVGEDGMIVAEAISVNLVSELNNIDFAKMIGGPLQAAIQAQAASAVSTVNFIKAVSYTHLDVYKRQPAKYLREAARQFFAGGN